jgi:hypothetical protein
VATILRQSIGFSTFDLKILSVDLQNLGFSSSHKIGREILGFRKTLFWELVPCLEVTLVFKFWKKRFKFFASSIHYRTYSVLVLDSSFVLSNTNAFYRTSPVRYRTSPVMLF